MHNRAIFLDRDGTINEDPGYISDPEKVFLIPGSAEALLILKSKGYLLVVISNQSGIARGLMNSEDVDRVNEKINRLLSDYNVSIDAFYYCNAHPEYSSPEECSCRKPSPEMVFRAADDLQINLMQSYFIGDSLADVQCGINAGLKTILVKTGKGKETLSLLQKENNFPSFVADNLLNACEYILDDK